MTETGKEIGAPGWRPREVHPLAALFPMLAEDDLAALAEHIKENGLQQPIVIDDTGQLIDGRNRLAACDLAGVEPVYSELNGHDAVAFIWGANTKRRQMTKGQVAMIGAMGFPNVGKSAESKVAKMVGVSHGTMGKAFAVKQHAPDLVERIIAGELFLDPAYVTAQARKKEADWANDGLAMLRKHDPELVRRVEEGELTDKLLVQERARANLRGLG
jgi:hypothetical protein